LFHGGPLCLFAEIVGYVKLDDFCHKPPPALFSESLDIAVPPVCKRTSALTWKQVRFHVVCGQISPVKRESLGILSLEVFNASAEYLL
jgi:hypothetical protein